MFNPEFPIKIANPFLCLGRGFYSKGKIRVSNFRAGSPISNSKSQSYPTETNIPRFLDL